MSISIRTLTSEIYMVSTPQPRPCETWSVTLNSLQLTWPETQSTDLKILGSIHWIKSMNYSYKNLLHALSCSNCLLTWDSYGSILFCWILLCCLREAKSILTLFWITISHPGWALQIFAGFGLLSFSQRLLQFGRSTKGTLLNGNTLKERKLIGRKSERAFILTQPFPLLARLPRLNAW